MVTTTLMLLEPLLLSIKPLAAILRKCYLSKLSGPSRVVLFYGKAMVIDLNALIGYDRSFEDITEPEIFDKHYMGGKFEELDGKAKIILSGIFDMCNFTGASLNGCILSGTFIDCNFTNTDFTGADLSGAVFKGKCNFSGSKLNTIRGLYNCIVYSTCVFNTFESRFNVKLLPFSKKFTFILASDGVGGNTILNQDEPRTSITPGIPDYKTRSRSWDFDGFSISGKNHISHTEIESEFGHYSTPLYYGSHYYKAPPKIAVLITSDEDELDGKT